MKNDNPESFRIKNPYQYKEYEEPKSYNKKPTNTGIGNEHYQVDYGWGIESDRDQPFGLSVDNFESAPTKLFRKLKTEKEEQFYWDLLDATDLLVDVMLKKHNDYGPTNISGAPGGPLNGLSVRLYDKIARLNNLVQNNIEPNNESLFDTFLDIANYGIIGMLVLEDKWDKGN